jgi:hypothetical protein
MKNKKLGILAMLLCVVVLGEAQTKQPRIARAEKTKQEIANAENELTEALFKADKDMLDDGAAVATILSTWKTKTDNEEVVEQYQATHFWTKAQGRWRLAAAHVSVVAK